MKPTLILIPDWKRVTGYSLSFWMQVIGLAVMIVPEILFAVSGKDSNPVFLWWLGILLLLAGTLGRIFKQGDSPWREWMRLSAVVAIITLLSVLLAGQVFAAAKNTLKDQSRVSQTTEAQTLAIAVPFIAGWEGKRNTAYQDIVGVWTICYGSTRGVRAGMKMTDAECAALLRDEVAEYRHGLHAYFTDTTKSTRLTPERDTAYVSLAFNAGIRGIGRSTATRRLNAGDIAGGCQALTWWNKAGGRVIRGLVNRRTAERDLCMKGL